jgi:dihydroorotate dehydrogenase
MTATTAVEYAHAGAALVQMGTASFAWPRAVTEAIAGLIQWGRENRVSAWDDLVFRPPSTNASVNRSDLLDSIESSGET